MEITTEALSNIDLMSVLALCRNEGDRKWARLYHQIIDSYATADQGRLTGESIAATR
jgi:hypothetical protein